MSQYFKKGFKLDITAPRATRFQNIVNPETCLNAFCLKIEIPNTETNISNLNLMFLLKTGWIVPALLPSCGAYAVHSVYNFQSSQ